MREAMLYERLKDQEVRCRLCSHRCKVKPDKTGLCGVRKNIDGALYSLVYGRVVARHVDPIEKKPLYHFLPGSRSYSIATVGCNFRCDFCQNFEISQMPKDQGLIIGETMTPEEIVSEAQSLKAVTISYTYTEPTIYFELAYDCAKLAQKVGIRNVFVSNGYMTREALDTIRPYLQAANVDLKGDDSFYRRHCGARQGPVLETLRYMKELGIWVEVTTLLIPGENDSPEAIRELARFIKEELGPGTPWHISRFYPRYHLTGLPPTEAEKLAAARQVGLEIGLHYVYTGNVPGDPGEKTYCYSCGQVLIDRFGFSILEYHLDEGRCEFCGAEIDGVWS
ncbi:AmmeMemoRadiSam system radical SAM enzyme [Thermosulfuriphilus sp.]